MKKTILQKFTVIRVTCSLLTLFFISGCQSYLPTYSDAQKHFNTASQLQTSKVFEPSVGNSMEAAVLASNQILANYSLALKLISEVIEKYEPELTKDQLLGNALTIKALSQWQLGKTDGALATRKEALNHIQLLYPRDKALMMALPGLIKAEQANTKRLNKESYLEIKDLIVGENGAMGNFEKALKELDSEHPVRLYIIMSQMAAIRTVHSSTSFYAANKQKDERAALKTDYYKPLRSAFQKSLKLFGLDKDPASNKLLEKWAMLFGDTSIGG